MNSHSRDTSVVEVVDCGWEVHDQMAGAVKSGISRAGGSSLAVLLKKD